MEKGPRVTMLRDGPYVVYGGPPLLQGGEALEVPETYTLCRCGRSRHQPYCDGLHLPARFDGSETAGEPTANGAPAADPSTVPCVVLVDDASMECGGPICVRGGLPIVSSRGVPYALRDPVTLCRCGKSARKPFCDR
jgi:CDGSH-type Zn-finger protein